jgi:predicted nucleotidyltransferase
MTKQIVLVQLRGCMEEIRRRFSVKRLCVFGSVVRGESAETSDVDVLVVFDGKASFDAFMDLKFYLEELLGTRVDLVTDKAIRPQLRRAIEAEIIDVA